MQQHDTDTASPSLKGVIERMKDTKQQWFKDAKYGLFIHWGLFSVLAGEYKGIRTTNIAEWIMHDLQIPPIEYEKIASEFNPDAFDARDIVRRAKEWGMQYIVFTAKHHEGFAMYHSACSSYNIVDATPCGRDVLKELREACDEFGVKLCLYYSQAQDWHDPNGTEYRTDNSKRDFQYYLEHKCKPQLRELLTEYGEIGLIWFDTPVDMNAEQSKEVFDLVKSIQPDCIVSGRIGNNMGEYMTTGDNFIPSMPLEGDWEVPATLNDTWGYSRYDTNWKQADDIIRLLVKINSRGGNYLLNIGPDARGNIPEGSVQVLDAVGTYVKENQEGIFGTKYIEEYPYDLEHIYFTRKEYRLYIHVLKPQSKLDFLNIGNKLKRAYVLRDRTELAFEQRATCEGDSFIAVHLPKQLQQEKNYCICLELAEKEPVFEPLRA